MLDRANQGDVLGAAGGLQVRLARDAHDVEAAQALRALVFGRAHDADEFDSACDHIVVEEESRVVATYRLLAPERAGRSYVATEFDVDALYRRHRGKRFLELGRSCVGPGHRTRRVMELLWHGAWAYVVREGFDVMLGCASLPGTVPDRPLLGFLHAHARAPEDWRVRALPGRGVAMDGEPAAPREALRRMPPLIKGYLRLGAHVGEEAVIDPDFGTTDVLVLLRREAISQRYLDHFGTDASRYSRG